ncbi:MAG: pseudouridine synthase, partial [Alphaproteobacteria bacterium]
MSSIALPRRALLAAAPAALALPPAAGGGPTRTRGPAARIRRGALAPRGPRGAPGASAPRALAGA